MALQLNARRRVIDMNDDRHGHRCREQRRTIEQLLLVIGRRVLGQNETRYLTTADQNAKNNGIANIEFVEGDVFELLSSYTSARKSFDTVVLDPPAFAKSRKQVDGAARGYKDINLRALRLLETGGILVTCSCSHHMSEAALMEIATDAASDAGRTVRVLEVRRQAQDHPVLLSVPETLYLKCLILQIV